MTTERLTVAQAAIRFFCSQRSEIRGEIFPLFSGVWAIFGHGNVAGIGEALWRYRDSLPTYRGHCEQSMAHAAIAYAKQTRRRRMMICTSSIGPGATNMVTAAAVAHVNRMPVLFLPGDTFAARAADPVLQQVEQPHDPNITANDCFRPVSRYFDRITAPEQLLTSLPQAIAILTDAELCGPVTIAMPQDVQAQVFDFPASFFEPRLHRIERPGADPGRLAYVAGMIQKSKRPILVAGGGVHYSDAVERLRDFVSRRRLPVVETSAGKGAVAWNDKMNAGAVGVIGTGPANSLVEECDLVVAIGSRLSDFTTGSRTGISNNERPQVNINVGHFDSHKHEAIALRSDADRAIAELDSILGDWSTDDQWVHRLAELQAAWSKEVESILTPVPDRLPSDGQVTAVINRAADVTRDVLVVAAGSMPAEGAKLWRTEYSRGYHAEYGYSCMGYEIAGGLGVKMADPEAEVFVAVGDGSYLMLNSEIATSVMLERKIIIVVLDNRGYGCINRLQEKCGSPPFNNLLTDCLHNDIESPGVDFAQHARSLGASAEHVDGLEELANALERAKAASRTYVIVIDTNPEESTGGGAWWEVGVPQSSELESVRRAHADWWQPGKARQPARRQNRE